MPESVSAVGRYGPPGWLRAGLPLLALAAWFGAAVGDTYTLVVPAYLTLLAAADLALPPTLVDRDGVRVGARRYPFRRVIGWGDVGEVIVSGPHEADDRVRLRLADGDVVILRYLPRSRAAPLADLAQVALTRGFAAPPAPPPPPTRYPTASQQERDLTARATRLALQNQDLRTTLDSIRRTTQRREST